MSTRRIKKVLLISHEMSYTGAPRSLLNMAKVLQKEKIKVSVWSLETGEFEREFAKEKIEVKLSAIFLQLN